MLNKILSSCNYSNACLNNVDLCLDIHKQLKIL